jgi:hypothetical protein
MSRKIIFLMPDFCFAGQVCVPMGDKSKYKYLETETSNRQPVFRIRARCIFDPRIPNRYTLFSGSQKSGSHIRIPCFLILGNNILVKNTLCQLTPIFSIRYLFEKNLIFNLLKFMGTKKVRTLFDSGSEITIQDLQHCS